jgi:large subunit ribosomal protein L15
MKLHELKATPGARKRSKRIGRGEASGQGKTSGKGHKGQWARKGHKFKEGFEGGQMPLIRRIPKHGFTNPTRKEYLGVNVESLAVFEEGTEITPELIKKQGLANGTCRYVKILGRGELTKKLVVKAHGFTGTAKTKIESAGGTCEIVGA